MSKKVINQNTNYNLELLNSIGSNFIFQENPINRLKNTPHNLKNESNVEDIDKEKELVLLKEQINLVEDCNPDELVYISLVIIGEAEKFKRSFLVKVNR